MRGSSSVFLAGHGGAFAGGSAFSSSNPAIRNGGRAPPTSSTSTANPSTKYPMGRRTSSSDDMTASSIEMARGGGGGDGGDYDGKGGWKIGRSRSKCAKDKDGYGAMAEEYEVQPFGEVLVTRTVMVDRGREREEDKKGDEMV